VPEAPPTPWEKADDDGSYTSTFANDLKENSKNFD
jgi:hypothetical protein